MRKDPTWKIRDVPASVPGPDVPGEHFLSSDKNSFSYQEIGVQVVRRALCAASVTHKLFKHSQLLPLISLATNTASHGGVIFSTLVPGSDRFPLTNLLGYSQYYGLGYG